MGSVISNSSISKHGNEFVVTSDWEGVIQVSDARSRILLAKRSLGKKIQRLAVRTQQPQLVAGAFSKGVIIYNVKTNVTVELPELHDSNSFSMAFSLDGRRLAVGCDSGAVYVYEVPRNEAHIDDPLRWTPQKALRAHAAAVKDIRFADDDKLLTASYDSHAMIWDVNSGKGSRLPRATDKRLNSITRFGKHAVAGGVGRSIIVWDISSELREFHGVPNLKPLTLIHKGIDIGVECTYLLPNSDESLLLCLGKANWIIFGIKFDKLREIKPPEVGSFVACLLPHVEGMSSEEDEFCVGGLSGDIVSCFGFDGIERSGFEAHANWCFGAIFIDAAPTSSDANDTDDFEAEDDDSSVASTSASAPATSATKKRKPKKKKNKGSGTAVSIEPSPNAQESIRLAPSGGVVEVSPPPEFNLPNAVKTFSLLSKQIKQEVCKGKLPIHLPTEVIDDLTIVQDAINNILRSTNSEIVSQKQASQKLLETDSTPLERKDDVCVGVPKMSEAQARQEIEIASQLPKQALFSEQRAELQSQMNEVTSKREKFTAYERYLQHLDSLENSLKAARQEIYQHADHKALRLAGLDYKLTVDDCYYLSDYFGITLSKEAIDKHGIQTIVQESEKLSDFHDSFLPPLPASLYFSSSLMFLSFHRLRKGRHRIVDSDMDYNSCHPDDWGPKQFVSWVKSVNNTTPSEFSIPSEFLSAIEKHEITVELFLELSEPKARTALGDDGPIFIETRKNMKQHLVKKKQDTPANVILIMENET